MNRNINRSRGVFVTLFLTMSLETAHAQPASRIAQDTFPSVVLLTMEDSHGQPLSLGSGFFVQDSVIATNLHVIEDASGGYAKLIGQQATYRIEGIVGIDEQRDLVLLSVKGAKAPTLAAADSTITAIGDTVYAVGNPKGLEGTFSQGIVSGIRKVGADELLQITAPISPGSSGGPVLNSKGAVIGIAVATFKEGQNLNFAIPSNYLTALLANVTPVKPFAGRGGIKGNASILGELGVKSTKGLSGAAFLWDKQYDSDNGAYSFSLRSSLSYPVRNVVCLVIFYGVDGEPIDVEFVKMWEKAIVPPNLAKRMSGHVDSSVRKLTTKSGVDYPSTPLEIRILDFDLAN